MPRTLIAALFLAICLASAAQEPAPSLKVGLATTTITPQGPVYMAGFASRTERSTGVYGELEASCIVLDDGTMRLGLMAIDIIGVGPVQVADIRQAAAEAGIAPECMMVNSSHTHCGPIFERNGDFPEVFRTRTCGLVAAAVADLRPATLQYTLSSCTMGISRRGLDAEGKASWRPAVDRAMDPDVPVLRVVGEDGAARALLFGYACHPTTIGGLQVGPDYPMHARELVSAALPGCLPVFLQGCGGDIKPRSLTAAGRFDYDSHDNLRELGHELGRAVLAGLCARPAAVTGPLGGLVGIVAAPMKKDPSRTSDIEVQVLRIGDLYLVGIEGEVCCEIGLRLKRELAGRRAWVCGYTNRRVGYIPAAASFPEGGYEVDCARHAAEAEHLLVAKATALVERLSSLPATIAPHTEGDPTQ